MDAVPVGELPIPSDIREAWVRPDVRAVVLSIVAERTKLDEDRESTVKVPTAFRGEVRLPPLEVLEA